MADIKKFIETIEVGNNMHSVIMIHGSEVLFEGYWAPYRRESGQRMYSETKSLVGIAIGMLEHEGKLSLDDPIYTFFPDKIERELPELLKRQTIRNNLMMSTAVTYPSWFISRDRDRVHLYFNGSDVVRAPGTLFTYDSTGSQVLGCLVERLSGMSLLDYIRSKTGLFPTAKILKTPTGESWCDSGLICTLREMAEFGCFVMNGCVTKDGRETVGRQYLADAVSNLIATDDTGFYSYKSLGYGYQIWHTRYDGFCFFGMGNQLTVCIPSKNFLFACTGDDQGNAEARRVLMDALFEYVIDRLDEPTDRSFKPVLTLKHAEGACDSPVIPSINHVKYVAEKNITGIKWFMLNFEEDRLDFVYKNAQGVKLISAGACKNIFGKFPEEGYSKEVGGESEPGHKYDAAFSYAFETDGNLLIQCRIIDEYLGNLSIFFGFNGEYATVRFVKKAENFLREYEGTVIFRECDDFTNDDMFDEPDE